MFKNKTVIVTGAAVGIGRATAIEFARGGASVAMVDLNMGGMENVKDEITAELPSAELSLYTCDISEQSAVLSVVTDVIKKYGKVDILVNNAALWRGASPFAETTTDFWQKMINVNIVGMLNFTHAVLPSMTENKYGRIINVGSVAGTYGNKNMAIYSMTKGAVSSFTKALAKEVAEYGITVNNMVAANVKNEEMGNAEKPELSYMNRSGRLEEFAWFIAFLASDKAAYISGQDHQIDGCRKKI